MWMLFLAQLATAGCDSSSTDAPPPSWAGSVPPLPTPHLVLSDWTEVDSVADAGGRTVRVTATVTNQGTATYQAAHFVPWSLPTGVELVPVPAPYEANIGFAGPIAPAASAAGSSSIELYVPTAAEAAYQAALASGFDGVVRGNEEVVTTATQRLVDDATLDLLTSRGTDGTLTFSATTPFLDGLQVGDLVVAERASGAVRVFPADCEWFPLAVGAITHELDGRVRLTPADSTLVYSSGEVGVTLNADGSGFLYRESEAAIPTDRGRRDVLLSGADSFGGQWMWNNIDFPMTGPLLRLHLADIEPVPGVKLTGDLLIEELKAPVAFRIREGDVEVDAEVALTTRFIGSVTADSAIDLDYQRALGAVEIQLTSVPVGITNISASIELELTLDADLQVEAGVATGVEIRSRQVAALHLDSGGGSDAKSYRTVEVLEATPPRMTEDSAAYASIGVGANLRLSVRDTYQLAGLSFTVGGSGRGELRVDPHAADPVQTGSAVEAHTSTTATILLAPITIADSQWTDSDLAPLSLPLTEPPAGGPPGRGRDQHWAAVFDGFGTARGYSTDLAGDHLVVERDGASVTTHLMSFGRDGQPGWAVQLPDFGGDSDALPDGGAVHFASDIIRVDDTGAVQWAWRRPDRTTLYSPATAVYTHPDGTDDIWTAHRYNVGKKERIARHDPATGEPLFYEEITADGGITMWDVLADAYGAILCGWTEQPSADDSGYVLYGAVMRFDRDGNLMWARKTSGRALGCAVHDDGGVLLYGSTNPEYYMPREELFAAEYDLDGGLAWHNTYALQDTGVPFMDAVDRWSGPHNIDGLSVAAPARDGWMLGGTTGYLAGEAVVTLLVDRAGNPISARLIDGVGVTSLHGIHQRGDAYLLAMSSPTPGEMVQSTEIVQVLAMMRHDGQVLFAPETGLETAGLDVVADHWSGDAGIWGIFTLRNEALAVNVADAGPWTELTGVTSTAESFPPVADGTWNTPCGQPCVPVVDTGDSGDTGPIDTGDTGPIDTGDTAVVDTDSGAVDTDSGATDTGTTGDDVPPGDESDGGCKDGCAQGSPAPLWLALPLLTVVRRRR